MDPIYAARIDKILENSSYMRGQWDATIPRLVERVDIHETRLDTQGRQIENVTTKAGIFGAISGTVLSAFLMWITRKF